MELRLALAQMHVAPGKPEANLARAGEFIAEAAAGGAGIVLLPEALDCGWTHPSARELAGPVPGGVACEALRAAARRRRITVCAGIVERRGDALFNAAVLVSPAGEILLRHRKIHELEFARALYSAGDRLSVVETPWGRTGVMICADAFAGNLAIARALGHMGAKLILSPCAWAVSPDSDEPYGDLWRESYGPPAREFDMVIAGCSNTGPVIEGEWRGWRCVGNSLVVGPGGQLAQGAREAEELQFVDLEITP